MAVAVIIVKAIIHLDIIKTNELDMVKEHTIGIIATLINLTSVNFSIILSNNLMNLEKQKFLYFSLGLDIIMLFL